MRALLRRLFVHEPHAGAHASYIALVARARNPFFYESLGVPDTLDGRFEMVLLHLFLLQHRLMSGAAQTEPDAMEDFSRELSELFFADMDRSVRELGVADTGVRYRIKAMAKAYHGRLIAYTTSIGDEEMLRGALSRNLYGTVAEGKVEHLAAMADYTRSMCDILAATDSATIIAGEFLWPEIGS
jgi:cytochrome b pre-mRNA-processing protein 3